MAIPPVISIWKQFKLSTGTGLFRLSKKLSRKRLYEFLAAEYVHIQPGARVLSIGAGGEINRQLYQYAERQGFHVLTLDIDIQRGPEVVGDVCEPHFQPESFDIVVMCEVLEHVHSPHIALEQIRKILRPGGRLILSVPFILGIHEAPFDYYRYTRHGLEFLLRRYRNLTIQERNGYFEAIDVLLARLPYTNHRLGRRLAYLFVILAFVRTPISQALDRIMRTSGLTTGYMVIANK